MIILDTNVASEPMKPQSNLMVADWLDRQKAGTLYLTAVNLAELMAGIEMAPEGRRRQGLIRSLALLRVQVAPEILPFDEAAATSYASIAAQAKRNRYTFSIPDGQIAAIAASHGYIVATRDVEPFLAAGVPVINPWESER
jgi:predicted nucleic acid-binding protein